MDKSIAQLADKLIWHNPSAALLVVGSESGACTRQEPQASL
jgi:hypothetical protein